MQSPSIIKLGAVSGAIMSGVVSAAAADDTPAGSAVPFCQQPFTVCIWSADATVPAKFTKFLSVVSDFSKTVKLRYVRTRIAPGSDADQAPECNDAGLDRVIAALRDDGTEAVALDAVKNASGDDGDAFRHEAAPGCGYAFRFTIDPDFRTGSQVCGYDIRLADDGWPPDAAAAAIYRPLDWNGDTLVIGELATIRLSPHEVGPEKPMAWVQLIAVRDAGDDAGNAYGTIGLLTGETEFDVDRPVIVRIGCGGVRIMSRRLRSYPTFTRETATGFLALIASGKKAIGPELHPIDVEALDVEGDGSADPLCSGADCATMRIAFDRQ